jgi:hypothetical protein
MGKENYNGYGYENIFIHTLPYPLTALPGRESTLLVGPFSIERDEKGR